MLTVVVPEIELFNEKTNEFFNTKGGTLILEHSLISISKWEAKYHKPFLENKQKNVEEIKDYVRYMTINKVSDDDIYKYMPSETLKEILDYIQDSMTATWFSKAEEASIRRKRPTLGNNIITAEVVYCWMIQMNVPIEFERWHFNRLLTLLKVVSIKSQPPRKMNTREAALQRQALNEQRLAKYHTKG